MSFTVQTVATKPFEGQKPGTSGLRKKVVVFEQPHYTENFVQACFNSLPADELKGCTMLVGGDGRYFLNTCIQIIFKIGAAAGVSKFIVGVDGIISTPTASCIIRKLKAYGGFVLTASHNPGGPTNDFGIKYNISNGGPAPESVTDRMFAESKTINEYRMADLPEIDISKAGTQTIKGVTIEVRDTVADYVEMCKQLYDFNLIKSLVSKPDFHMHIDCLSGVTGPYAKRIFEDELGAPAGSVVNCVPLPDFGGHHPDPNLTYAHDLVEAMNTGKYDIGAAFDGDGDRNMILGRDCFINPSDSVAMIAANTQYIPYLKGDLRGVARSMPTSGALDRVAAKFGIEFFETPTGWKFFGNLMDAGRMRVCGEESFGTGSDHVREKDGIWAALAWLSLLAGTGKSPKELQEAHWAEYGRNFFTRYDYEEVDSASADAMYKSLKDRIVSGSLNGAKLGAYTVKTADDFTYTDPIDGSVSKNQGLRIVFEDGSRIIVRLSGTGSSGATIRIYVEQYESDPARTKEDPQVALKPLVDIALELTKLKEHTGRDRPTVIT